MAELVKVKVRECPDGRHNGEGDWVALAPTLSLEGGLAAEAALRDAGLITDPQQRQDAITRGWSVVFIRYGARGWNFHDESGDLPFDVQAILDDYSLARPVAEQADGLYSEVVLRPFLERLGTRSPTGRTGVTTSKVRRRTRKQSKPSSPDTTAGSAQ